MDVKLVPLLIIEAVESGNIWTSFKRSVESAEQAVYAPENSYGCCSQIVASYPNAVSLMDIFGVSEKPEWWQIDARQELLDGLCRIFNAMPIEVLINSENVAGTTVRISEHPENNRVLIMETLPPQ